MKTYETMILLDNREVKKGWEPLKESVDSILTKRGAEIVVAKRWDERKLAYDIKKQRRATYYLSYLKADPCTIDEMRRDLELSVPVLRYLILSCEAVPEDAYEPEKEFTMVEVEEEVAVESKGDSEETKGDSEEAKGADGTEEAKGGTPAEGIASAEGAQLTEAVKPSDEGTETVVAEAATEAVTEAVTEAKAEPSAEDATEENKE